MVLHLLIRTYVHGGIPSHMARLGTSSQDQTAPFKTLHNCTNKVHFVLQSARIGLGISSLAHWQNLQQDINGIILCHCSLSWALHWWAASSPDLYSLGQRKCINLSLIILWGEELYCWCRGDGAGWLIISKLFSDTPATENAPPIRQQGTMIGE